MLSPLLHARHAAAAAAVALAAGSASGAPLAVARGAVPQAAPPAEVGELLAAVSPERMRRDIDTLAAFGTRHTLSETASESRGIGAARRWIHAELERAMAVAGDRAGAPAPRVSFDSHTVAPDGRRITREVEVVNVVAELPGVQPEARGRRYYVIGHYDSRATDPLDAASDAPGANDDASGVSVVLELARVAAGRRFDSTLVFMATAGEEQGLYGARLHAAAARGAGLDIGGVLSNDIVGDPSATGAIHGDRVRVFSEGLPQELDAEALAAMRRLGSASDSPSRQLARFAAEVAAWQGLGVRPMLVFRPDRFLRGGDHTAFNEAGYPAVRFTVVEENYHRQHQDVRTEDGVQYGDLPEFVDTGYLAGVARLNGATLAHLANAPAVPAEARIVAAELTNDTTLRWRQGSEPDLQGYEVVWRDTTSPVWQGARDVGRTTEATLPLSKDNHHFGVRAYDRQGYRSPVAFPAAARE